MELRRLLARGRVARGEPPRGLQRGEEPDPVVGSGERRDRGAIPRAGVGGAPLLLVEPRAVQPERSLDLGRVPGEPLGGGVPLAGLAGGRERAEPDLGERLGGPVLPLPRARARLEERPRHVAARADAAGPGEAEQGARGEGGVPCVACEGGGARERDRRPARFAGGEEREPLAAAGVGGEPWPVHRGRVAGGAAEEGGGGLRVVVAARGLAGQPLPDGELLGAGALLAARTRRRARAGAP